MKNGLRHRQIMKYLWKSDHPVDERDLLSEFPNAFRTMRALKRLDKQGCVKKVVTYLPTIDQTRYATVLESVRLNDMFIMLPSTIFEPIYITEKDLEIIREYTLKKNKEVDEDKQKLDNEQGRLK